MRVKWTKTQLIQTSERGFEFHDDLEFTSESFEHLDRLRNLYDVQVDGKGYYDVTEERLTVDLQVSGEMVLPCAITLEDVVVPFDLEATEIFSFHPVEDEEVHVCRKDWIDLNPVIFQLILSEVPLKVVKDDAVYPSGDGWEILSEAEYQRRKGNEIDPRLAKLKEFKFEDQ